DDSATSIRRTVVEGQDDPVSRHTFGARLRWPDPKRDRWFRRSRGQRNAAGHWGHADLVAISREPLPGCAQHHSTRDLSHETRWTDPWQAIQAFVPPRARHADHVRSLRSAA